MRVGSSHVIRAFKSHLFRIILININLLSSNIHTIYWKSFYISHSLLRFFTISAHHFHKFSQNFTSHYNRFVYFSTLSRHVLFSIGEEISDLQLPWNTPFHDRLLIFFSDYTTNYYFYARNIISSTVHFISEKKIIWKVVAVLK